MMSWNPAHNHHSLASSKNLACPQINRKPTMRRQQRLFNGLCALACLCPYGVVAFLAAPFDQPSPTTTHPTSSSSSSCLWGKVKRGQLGKAVDVEAAPARKSKKVTRSGNNRDNNVANISPALAEWASQQSDAAAAYSDDDAPSPPASKPNKRAGRIKQSARKAVEEARDERVEAWVKEFKQLLEEGKPTVDDLLARIDQLVQLPTGNFKQLSASATQQDFRLAWVGSDEAVTHIGTGLHKVPLARLQEVFLSFIGRNRIEIQEVIRILGPFPNVKNTLVGQSAFARGKDSDDDVVDWKLTWDSMVDGTGKEILAGKEENLQRVDLQVYFSSPSVVVAVVPPDADNISVRRTDPWQDNGQHVLVFVREDNLLEELEKLRVA